MEENIFKELMQAVIHLNPDATESVAKEVVQAKIDPLAAIEEGLAKGIRQIGDQYSKGEIFLSELVMAAEAMKAGLRVFEPELKKLQKKREVLGRVIVGTVAGDIHDIGKTIVAVMLEANGFEVIDLGVDVSTEVFVEKVKELKPDILGLSALLTVTMPMQNEVIEALRRAGLRGKVKVMIGGAPVTEKWAKEIEADEYGRDAMDAVRKAKKLMGLT